MSGSAAVMYWFFVVGLIIAIVAGGYAASWSLRLRRALRVSVYSRQALVVGLFAIYGTFLYTLFYVVYFLFPDLLNSSAGTLQEALYVLLWPILFAWLDNSNRVGRRTDPLLRDSLRWSKVRLVLWPLLILSLLSIYPLRTGVSETGLFSLVIIEVSVVPVLFAAKRSGDPYYRKSLEWFGFAVAVVVVESIGFNTLMLGLGTGIVYSDSGFVWSIIANFAIVPALFYGIYKCARSLVPLNRMSPQA